MDPKEWTFKSEILSPQKRAAILGRFRHMPLAAIKELYGELERIIDEKEAAGPDEMDSVWQHRDPTLIHKVYDDRGDKKKGKWRQLQTIYCSAKRCPKCPHGPYWFAYRRNKTHKTITVRFKSIPMFPPELIENLRKKLPPPSEVNVYKIVKS